MSTTPRRHALLTFDDLIADLVWPKLIKAGSLSLRPARIGLGLLALLLSLAVVVGADSLDGDATRKDASAAIRTIGANAVSVLDAALKPGAAGDDRKPETLANELYQLFVAHPALLAHQHPFLAPVVLIVMAGILSILGGAISRSAACDFALSRSISWPQALGFALSRWASLLGATLLPLVVLWLIGVGVATASTMLRVPGLDIIAGLAFGLVLLAGLVCAIIVIAYFAGQSLLVPAVACENTDAIDSVQRAYAFVFAKPLRLVVYSLLLVIQFAVLAIIVFGIAWLVVTFSRSFALAWSGDDGRIILGDLGLESRVAGMGEARGTQGFARITIQAWAMLPIGLAAAWVISYYWTACTLLYLGMRRICDGQDVQEIWHEALIPGTQAAASPIAADAPSAPVSQTTPVTNAPNSVGDAD